MSAQHNTEHAADVEPESRAVRLARARHHLAAGDTATWENLTDAERDQAAAEAARWIAAAAAAGLMHTQGPGPDDEEELPRRVLDDETDRAVYDAIADGAREYDTQLPNAAVDEIARTVCNRLGILTAPPEADPDTCTAQIPDADGWWMQCTEDDGHSTNAHDSAGEMEWTDGAHESVPATTTEAEQ